MSIFSGKNEIASVANIWKGFPERMPESSRIDHLGYVHYDWHISEEMSKIILCYINKNPAEILGLDLFLKILKITSLHVRFMPWTEDREIWSLYVNFAADCQCSSIQGVPMVKNLVIIGKQGLYNIKDIPTTLEDIAWKSINYIKNNMGDFLLHSIDANFLQKVSHEYI